MCGVAASEEKACRGDLPLHCAGDRFKDVEAGEVRAPIAETREMASGPPPELDIHGFEAKKIVKPTKTAAIR
jgi:hypothetical protein